MRMENVGGSGVQPAARDKDTGLSPTPVARKQPGKTKNGIRECETSLHTETRVGR